MDFLFSKCLVPVAILKSKSPEIHSSVPQFPPSIHVTDGAGTHVASAWGLLDDHDVRRETSIMDR